MKFETEKTAKELAVKQKAYIAKSRIMRAELKALKEKIEQLNREA